MASVANDDTDVVVLGEPQRSGNIGGLLNINSIADVVAECARDRSVRERIAALIGEICLHDRRRRRNTGTG